MPVYYPYLLRRDGARSSIGWYLAGGAATPLAVWQPKAGDGWSPGSLAESYINRVNPGTYDAAPGTAPTWAAATGWTFLAASSQYLTTGLVPAGGGYSLVARFNSASWAVGPRNPAGGHDGTPRGLSLSIRTGAPTRTYFNQGGISTGATAPAAGTMAVAGQQGYFDGTPDGGAIPTGATTWRELYIGCLNNNGVPSRYLNGVITAIAVWDITLTAAQVAAIHAALVAAGL